MTTFTPNLFGKVCFVLLSIIEYLFVVIPITKILLTHILIIDLMIYVLVMFLCGLITSNLIWKILKLWG